MDLQWRVISVLCVVTLCVVTFFDVRGRVEIGMCCKGRPHLSSLFLPRGRVREAGNVGSSHTTYGIVGVTALDRGRAQYYEHVGMGSLKITRAKMG